MAMGSRRSKVMEVPLSTTFFRQVRSVWLPRDSTLVVCNIFGAAVGSLGCSSLAWLPAMLCAWLCTWSTLVLLRTLEEREMDDDTIVDRSAIALRVLSLPAPVIFCAVTVAAAQMRLGVTRIAVEWCWLARDAMHV